MTNAPSPSFENIARAYDLLINETARWNREKPFHEYWMNQTKTNRQNQPPKVLDLGCGTGFHARHYAQNFQTKLVVGSDPSPAMLSSAKSKPGGNLVTWITAHAEKIPKTIGEFDLILLLGNTLSLIPDTTPIWKSVTQATQPGAFFIIQMLDYNRLREKNISPKITERSDGSVSIRKTLAIHHHPTKQGESATLNLIVKTNDGSLLAQENHVLYENPDNTWLPVAEKHGLSLHHKQSDFRVENPTPETRTQGTDRVYILRRS